MRFKKHKHKRNRPTCDVHKGPIKGRVHRWGNKKMCGKCYRYFTGHVHIVRHQPPPKRKGFWASLFG